MPSAHCRLRGDPCVGLGERLRHSVYAAYRAHVIALLGDTGYGGDVGYLADVLLGALVTELVLHQRRVLEMSSERLRGCWGELVRTLLPAA